MDRERNATGIAQKLSRVLICTLYAPEVEWKKARSEYLPVEQVRHHFEFLLGHSHVLHVDRLVGGVVQEEGHGCSVRSLLGRVEGGRERVIRDEEQRKREHVVAANVVPSRPGNKESEREDLMVCEPVSRRAVRFFGCI